MKDYLNFSGKHVIITGGRRGLGRAMSIAFAERGAKVAVVAANPDGSEIMADLEKAGTPGLNPQGHSDIESYKQKKYKRVYFGGY